jgi:hypothetical protein
MLNSDTLGQSPQPINNMTQKIILGLSSLGEVSVPLFPSPFLFATENGDELHRPGLLALIRRGMTVNGPSLAPWYQSRPRTVESSEDLLLMRSSIHSSIGMLVASLPTNKRFRNQKP